MHESASSFCSSDKFSSSVSLSNAWYNAFCNSVTLQKTVYSTDVRKFLNVSGWVGITGNVPLGGKYFCRIVAVLRKINILVILDSYEKDMNTFSSVALGVHTIFDRDVPRAWCNKNKEGDSLELGDMYLFLQRRVRLSAGHDRLLKNLLEFLSLAYAERARTNH